MTTTDTDPQWIEAAIGNQNRARLDACNVPNAPMFTPLETLQHPQTQACGMIQQGEGDASPHVGIPMKIDGHRLAPRQRAPAVGEHNNLYVSERGPGRAAPP